MAKERSHSRSGPGSTVGARDGAGGINPMQAAAAGEQRGPGTVAGDMPAATPAPGAAGEPLPLDPTLEYVAKADHEAVVEQLAGERDSMRVDLQRIAADFENYKRRAARASEQASAAAETRLLGELLTVIDDTERAIEHSAKPDASADAVVDGLRTVRARLDGVARGHGLEPIPTDVPFDPNLHEAMMVQAAPEGVAEGSILQVVQGGWTIGDRVLRHARVIVAGGD